MSTLRQALAARNQAMSTEFRGEPGHAVERQDVVLAKNAADLLEKHYPGYLWAVNVNSEGGVMDVKNHRISFKYGFRLMLVDVYQDPQLKCVVRAGGEMLERARLDRSRDRGDAVVHVEGVRAQDQPFEGIII